MLEKQRRHIKTQDIHKHARTHTQVRANIHTGSIVHSIAIIMRLLLGSDDVINVLSL